MLLDKQYPLQLTMYNIPIVSWGNDLQWFYTVLENMALKPCADSRGVLIIVSNFITPIHLKTPCYFKGALC